MTRVVMGINDWPENGQDDFIITIVKPGESDEEAIARGKELYSLDQECYITQIEVIPE